MSNINGPAGPLMYPDQIFRDRPIVENDRKMANLSLICMYFSE